MNENNGRNGISVLLRSSLLLACAGAPAGAQQFGPQLNLGGGLADLESVELADLDGDGVLDVLLAASDEDTVAWYRNRLGGGVFGAQRVITGTAPEVQSAWAADLDGDGDLDVLTASQDDDTIAWHENLLGDGTFGPAQVITSTADAARFARAADLDGDGDADVVAGSTGFADQTLSWFENTDGAGTFGPEQVVDTGLGSLYALGIADVDGDADLDLAVSTFNSPGLFAWYENVDGRGSFGVQHVITPLAVNQATDFHAADLDGDGDLDFAAASILDDDVTWYENTDGAGSFGPAQVVGSSLNGATSVRAADLDGDGDLDLLAAARLSDLVVWFENTDGAGSFGPAQTLSSAADGAGFARAADLDGDGDLDVVSANTTATAIPDGTQELAWYENLDGAGTFAPGQLLAQGAESAEHAVSADLDGDGGMDVLFCAHQVFPGPGQSRIGWFPNDGYGNFGAQRIVTEENLGPRAVAAADLDGDGDVDAVSASITVGMIAWYENTDGLGQFGPFQAIETFPGDAWSVFAHDMDLDGDLDVLAGWYDNVPNHEIRWYENSGAGGLTTSHVVASGPGSAIHVQAADVDGDGDPDVLDAQWELNSSATDQITWYRNLGGGLSFSGGTVISTAVDGTRWVTAADVDGDLDLDVLSASQYDSKVAWYENTDGLGSFGPQQVVSTASLGVRSVAAADVDGDDDADLVVASSFGNGKIAWYENLDGLGGFGIEQPITTNAQTASSVHVADLDSDGDPDVISTSVDDDKVSWYENLLCCRLDTTTVSISLAAGGTQTYDLDAGTVNGSGLYWLLGTTSGALPGQGLPPTALKLPLNLDGFFLFTLLRPNVLIPSSLAFFDGQGTAQTSLVLPPGLDGSLAGLKFHHAYLVIGLPSLLATYVSNAVPLALVP